MTEEYTYYFGLYDFDVIESSNDIDIINKLNCLYLIKYDLTTDLYKIIYVIKNNDEFGKFTVGDSICLSKDEKNICKINSKHGKYTFVKKIYKKLLEDSTIFDKIIETKISELKSLIKIKPIEKYKNILNC